MKKWCPIAHTDCEDGLTKESECICVHWDSLNNECQMTKSFQLTVDGHILTNRLMEMRISDEEALEKKIGISEKEL